MAIYHNKTQIIGRQAKDKNKQPIPGKQVSMLAKAAYRSGDRLKDERIDKTFDYRARAHEAARTGILAPDGSPAWLSTNEAQEGKERREQRGLREKLWNSIEAVEKRKDSQLAREFELALPRELTEDQNVELLRGWCKSEIVSKGYVVDYAIHRSKDGQNPHAHILCTTRPVEENAPSGFGKKPDMSGKFNGRGQVGKAAKADLEDWRETWGKAQNAALEAAGHDARVDHRTLEAQEIDRTPGVHVGVAAAAMERKGIETEKVDRSMWAKMDNLIRSAWRGIERTGEVPQTGTGRSWWERAEAALDWTIEQAGGFLRDESSGGRNVADTPTPAPAPAPEPASTYWQDYIREREQNERGLPEPEMG